MKRKIFGLFIVMMGLVFMGCSNAAIDPPTADEVVTLMELHGNIVPVRGAMPVTTIDTEQYSGTIIWTPGDNPFKPETGYEAEITLTAKEGWTLTGMTAGSFTVDGITATVSDSGIVAVTFPATFAAPILSMVTVPAGSFQRDGTDTNISTISNAYKMSEKEITTEEFVATTGLLNPSTFFTDVVNGPVQMANWYHALVFCNKLSIAEGLTPVYTIRSSTVPDAWDGTTDGTITVPIEDDTFWNGATADWSATGYRLPSEMEWMWAAMGATSDRSNGYDGNGINTTGYIKGYAGSMETGAEIVNIGNYAWYNANGGSTTHPVGTAGTTGHPNELGLYDMSGNVLEWCWDWADFTSWPSYTITGSVTSDSAAGQGAVSGSCRVVRGGSFHASICAVAARDYDYLPDSQHYFIGFRVVRL